MDSNQKDADIFLTENCLLLRDFFGEYYKFVLLFSFFELKNLKYNIWYMDKCFYLDVQKVKFLNVLLTDTRKFVKLILGTTLNFIANHSRPAASGIQKKKVSGLIIFTFTGHFHLFVTPSLNMNFLFIESRSYTWNHTYV